jgi:hypothetical protein
MAEDNDLAYFQKEEYQPIWTEGGTLENPTWYYSLNHSDASYDIYDLRLNEFTLFALATEQYETRYFGGFYYNPIPSDERDDVAHYYPVNHRMNPGFERREEAALWALNMFFSMYDSINFQYKVFIYKHLLAYCIGNEWLMLAEGEVVSENIPEIYCIAMNMAKNLYEQKEMELQKAQRAFRSFM